MRGFPSSSTKQAGNRRWYSRVRFALPLLALAVLASGAFLLAACGDDDSGGATQTATTGPVQYHGALPQPAIKKPAAVLTDTSNQPFDLQKQTQGYITLFYLGYTHCPDICPQHMANIAAALKTLTPDQRAKYKVVFVTTDPARDTPDVLRKWLDSFDTSFIGLTGTQQQLDALQQEIGLPPAQKESDGQGGYGVSHAAFVMAFTTDNLAHIVYPDGVTPADWRADLATLATVGWKPS